MQSTRTLPTEVSQLLDLKSGMLFPLTLEQKPTWSNLSLQMVIG